MPTNLDQQRLTALSLAERTVLGLLAQGHTAKSIAVSIGTTESAVNERLREARRKTGVSSSRELARALAQENWSKDFGVEPPAADKPPAVKDVDRHGRRWGVTSMLAALTAAVVFAMVSHTGRQSAPADAMTDHFATLNPPSLSGLRRQLINEGRDPVWTSSTEAAVRERIQKLIAAGAIYRVTCSRTLCEVVGALPNENAPVIQHEMDELQGDALRADLRALGLDAVVGDFGGAAPGKPNSMAFVQYWKRAGSTWPIEH